MAKASSDRVPRHVAIIMDGNGRWARERGLPRIAGHRAGTENIRRILRCLSDHGVKCITLYAFSTENWGRPQREVQGLMKILDEAIQRESQELHREGVRIVHLGGEDGVPEELRDKVRQAIELTRDNSNSTLCVAFNYGGRAEIVEAVRRIMRKGIPPEEVDEELISSHLYTRGLPDPDLIIRTAGEMRISNFLLWQSAYSEYYSTPTLWPDFGAEEVEKALAAYSQRERRFGGVKRKG